MKLNRNDIREMILNELRIINESKFTSAISAIKDEAVSIQLASSGSTSAQQGVASIIGKFADFLRKEEITGEDVANMKKYIDSIARVYFSEK